MSTEKGSRASNALDEITRLQSQIEKLKDSALSELRERKQSIEAELRGIDAELERLTGKAARGRGARGAKRLVTLVELREMLAAAPNYTLNIRREQLDFLNVKTLVHANPAQLVLGGRAPWPTVTLKA